MRSDDRSARTAPVAAPHARAMRRIARVPTLTIAQDPTADELLGRDPLALLIGMLLDKHMRRRSS